MNYFVIYARDSLVRRSSQSFLKFSLLLVMLAVLRGGWTAFTPGIKGIMLWVCLILQNRNALMTIMNTSAEAPAIFVLL